MFMDLIHILLFFSGFSFTDYVLTKFKFEGVYYFNHAIHNSLIVYSTFPDVLLTLTKFGSMSEFPTNVLALQLCFALHFYHIAFYWRKFRGDDWLHHVLMIGIALPIGGFFNGGPLLGYNLFFTTGLPGGLDYFLLFFCRNGLIGRDLEKRINAFLHVWIRSPGCASHAGFVLAHLFMSPYEFYKCYGSLIVAFLTYWNGQYFMQQVVYDAGIRRIGS